MTPPDRFFCADAARARHDPFVGTAPFGSVWVLIEYRRAWPADGFDGIDLDPETKTLVFAAARANRARILLVRRHGRRRFKGSDRWAVLHHQSSGVLRQRWGSWHRDQDLAQIVTALDSPGEPGLAPVVLVCAHGLHDACCAVRGRPVGQALSARWPDLVWECTHVGGDRFAANVVVVPDGVYYGNLDPRSALTVVEDHLADRIRADHLRGYTTLRPPQQAAVAAVLRHFGPAGRHDYAVTATVAADDGWRVSVNGRAPHPRLLDVEVRARRTPARQLTCRGPANSSALVYDVTSVRDR
ncbi:sucrase ferredoxin [Streptomyces sp. FL06-04B]|uniref:sucrase ferredoxin n=1 Tax=unclassified Streptomyces TaxID=2593676 RepID=UPI0029A7A443|nr:MULTISPECIES: sucrase ferredoxin [unclassified Streptomyces]MDX3605040.1 sucrase ferredoxin [Streptomyces sp. FL06-04B]MDX3735745.1 sucrase ferredoxin [Streptomyces sp. ID01-15D]